MSSHLDLDDVCVGHPAAMKELEELRQQATQRGERLQILREWMRQADWYHFTYDYPDADTWFDVNGIPR